MTGKEQARILGLLMWVYAGFQIVIVAVIGVFYALFFSVFLTRIPHKPHDPSPEFMLPFIVIAIVIAFCAVAIFSIPKWVAGYGLRNDKSWARVWAIVASCLACLSFPVGTALGVWGLIFLFGDEGKRYFESSDYARVPNPADEILRAPEPNSWQ